MTDIITVALSKLDADPRNVRKTYSAEGIEALAANVQAETATGFCRTSLFARATRRAAISSSPADAD